MRLELSRSDAMEKTLYVTDLDGTLLNKDAKVSEFSQKALKVLIEQGMLLSYATARSLVTSSVITGDIPITLPVIVNNGVRAIDPVSRKILFQNNFSEDKYGFILDFLTERGIYPIVYYTVEGCDRFSYIPTLISEETKAFLGAKLDDGRNLPLGRLDGLCRKNPYYFVCIGKKEKIVPVYNELCGFCGCVTYTDIYSDHQWLEVFPDGSGKASACLWLKEYVGADKLIVFGDGKNDISMFEAADFSYAVENADYTLKERANGIIGANTDDGVAKWLLENAGVKIPCA